MLLVLQDAKSLTPNMPCRPSRTIRSPGFRGVGKVMITTARQIYRRQGWQLTMPRSFICRNRCCRHVLDRVCGTSAQGRCLLWRDTYVAVSDRLFCQVAKDAFFLAHRQRSHHRGQMPVWSCSLHMLRPVRRANSKTKTQEIASTGLAGR